MAHSLNSAQCHNASNRSSFPIWHQKYFLTNAHKIVQSAENSGEESYRQGKAEMRDTFIIGGGPHTRIQLSSEGGGSKSCAIHNPIWTNAVLTRNNADEVYLVDEKYVTSHVLVSMVRQARQAPNNDTAAVKPHSSPTCHNMAVSSLQALFTGSISVLWSGANLIGYINN